MNIAIDITPLGTDHKQRGVGRYTKNLVDALQKYESRHSYSLFTRKQKVSDNVDLVHYPYFDPFFLTLPLVKTKPTVVTVHDLIPLVFPDKFPAGIRGRMKWQIQKQSLRGAKRILTDSNSSRNDIAAIVGIKKEMIDTVYLAPDSVYHVSTNTRSLPKKYILYVGDVNWNKNIPGLLRAFARLKTVFKQRQSSLVLVGGAFMNESLPETKEINRLIDAPGIEQSVSRVGHVLNEELIKLYSGATALIQPSFYEGFGLPVLEAMACGCPVICTHVSSLKEIAGPAIRVQPDAIESIADGMKYALSLSYDARKKLIKEGSRWVGQFTWEKVAKETVASYERALV